MAAPKRVLRDPPYTVGQRPAIPKHGLGPSVMIGAGRVRTVEVRDDATGEVLYTREEWDRTIEVYISPAGWNTRVFVDGIEVE